MDRELKAQFRIAPTPSGYLHLGNILNFVLTKSECLRTGGELRLRLDDIDHSRVRTEYIEDVFRTLEWLGIEYDHGPMGVEDFKRHYSQVIKRDLYHNALKKISQRFICSCSRKEVQEASIDGQYPGTCYQKNLAFKRDKTCIRLRTRADFSFDGTSPHEQMRDFLIWSKEDLPSYQLVSVVDDLEDGITHIIRGLDLKPSSAAQVELASHLEEEDHFRAIHWHHHQLLRSPRGGKLSKSKNDLSLKLMREANVKREEVYQELARLIGLETPRRFQSLNDFISLPSLYTRP